MYLNHICMHSCIWLEKRILKTQPKTSIIMKKEKWKSTENECHHFAEKDKCQQKLGYSENGYTKMREGKNKETKTCIKHR